MPGNPEPSVSPSPSPSPAHAVSGEDVAARILSFCSFVAPEQLSATRHAIRRYAEAGGRPAALLQRFAEGCPRWDWAAAAVPPAMPSAAEEDASAASRTPNDVFEVLLRAGAQRAVFPGDRASAATAVDAANPAPPPGSSIGGSGKRARFTDVEGGSTATPAPSQGSDAAEATGLPVAEFSFADVTKLKLDGGGGGAVVAEFGELQASEGATTVHYGDASFRQDEAAAAEGEGEEGLQRTATFHAPQEPLPGMEKEMRISRIIEQAERTRMQQQMQQQELEQEQQRQQQQQQQRQQQQLQKQEQLQREELLQRQQQQQQQLQEQQQRQQQEQQEQQGQQEQQRQQEEDLRLEQDLSALLGTPDVHTARRAHLPADSDAATAADPVGPDLLPPPPPADVERSASFASDAGFAPLPSSSGQESEAVVISDSEDDETHGVADAFDGLTAAGGATPAAATPLQGDEAFPFPTGPQPAAPIHSSEPQPDAGRRASQTPRTSTPATPRPAHAQVITMDYADAAFAAAAVSTPEVAKAPAAPAVPARPSSSSSSSKVVQHLHSQLLHKQRTNWHLMKDREDRLRRDEEQGKQRRQQQQQRYQHQQQRQQQLLQQRRSTGNPLLQRTKTTTTFSAPSVTPALLSPLTRVSVFEEPEDVVAADAFDDDVPPEYSHDVHRTPTTAAPPPASSVATNAPPALAYEYDAPLRGSSADSDSSSASTCDTTTLVMEIRGLQSLVDREARRGRALRTSAHASLRATRDGAVGALCASTIGGPATPPVLATAPPPPPHASGVGGGGVSGALDGGGFGLSGSKQLPRTDDVSLRLPFTPFVPSRLRATPRPPSFPASQPPPPPPPTAPVVFPPGQQHVSLPRSKSYLNLPHTGGGGGGAPAAREWAPQPRMKPRTLSPAPPPPPPPPPPAAMTAVSAAGVHGVGRRRSSLPCTTSLKSPELRGDGGGGGGSGGVSWMDAGAGPSQTAILTALPVSGGGPGQMGGVGGVGRGASLLLSRPQHASRAVSPPRNPPPAL
eukprot:Rhum_TRINITY_DN14292_c9_g1::Rhum_TRINITY_DN14292_c9_g1_i1::g.78196::m.78196